METPPPIPPVSQPRTAGLAIASLVLGLLAITCCSILAGIPALILGSLALQRIGASGGTLGGKIQALVGIVMGVVSFALLPLVAGVLAIATSVVLPAVSAAQAQAQEAVCLHNVRQGTAACVDFAREHDTALPVTWADVEKYFSGVSAAKSTLHCHQDQGVAVSYELVHPGRRLAELGPPAETVIVREICANHHGRRAIGFADGHVEMRADTQ